MEKLTNGTLVSPTKLVFNTRYWWTVSKWAKNRHVLDYSEQDFIQWMKALLKSHIL